MSGVLAQPVGRQDVLVRRGTTARWGVLWEQDTGAGFAPVNMLGWVGVLRLTSLNGDVWLEQEIAPTSDGYAIAELAPAVMAGPVWAGRRVGSWAITVTSPDGLVERLGEGTIRIED